MTEQLEPQFPQITADPAIANLIHRGWRQVSKNKLAGTYAPEGTYGPVTAPEVNAKGAVIGREITIIMNARNIRRRK